jgi:hypothetical protein
VLTAGWLYDNVGHSTPFLIQAVIVLVPLVMVHLWVEEPKKTEG